MKRVQFHFEVSEEEAQSIFSCINTEMGRCVELLDSKKCSKQEAVKLNVRYVYLDKLKGKMLHSNPFEYKHTEKGVEIV